MKDKKMSLTQTEDTETLTHDNMDVHAPNSDIIVEILSWLPAESLLIFETISKGWHKTINNNSFRRVHCQRAKMTISGFFMQDWADRSNQVRYLSFDTTGDIVRPKVWDFLAGKIVLAASSNGLLCCFTPPPPHNSAASYDGFIYVCNPATKECIPIEWPKGSKHCDDFALACDPLCNMHDYLDFKLVCVGTEYPSGLSFQVYSSKTKEWRKLDIFRSDYKFGTLYGINVLCSGVLYWMTFVSGIIALDVETEQPYRIPFPVPWMHQSRGLQDDCIGESEGRLHYVLISDDGLKVWFLDPERKWALIHSISLSAMEEKYPNFVYKVAKRAAGLVPRDLEMSPWIEPLAFKDGVLLLKLRHGFSYQNKEVDTRTKLYAYNIGSGNSLEEMCTFENAKFWLGFFKVVPYSMTLAPLESAEVALF